MDIKMNELITLETTPSILKEIEDAFYDIPFENSQFQTESFVIAAQITPERAYRAIGLRMFSKLRALNEAKHNIQNQQIDLEEIEHKISSGTLDQFETRRQMLKKEKILSEQGWSKKLINDALVELSVLYKHFKALPKFTRQEFEAGERLHYEQRLRRSIAGLEGAKESIINMNEDISALEQLESEIAKLLPGETLNRDRLASLPNILHIQQESTK